MFITHIAIHNFPVKLSHPFTYAKTTLDILPYVLVHITTDAGIEGYGEGALAWDVTGETQAGARQIMDFLIPEILQKPLTALSDVRAIMKLADTMIFGNTGLKAGIESALLDAIGKYQKKPVYALFDPAGSKKRLFLQKTFSYEEQLGENLGQNLIEAKNKGVKIFKFKVGQSKDHVIHLMNKVTLVASESKIILDVNQAWESNREMYDFFEELENFRNNILCIEQPIYYANYKGLAELRRKTSFPIMVDESCHSLIDLQNLYLRKCLDFVNIKLAKCGGFFEALSMVHFCDAHNISYILGDMIHSQLGTAANVHLGVLGNFMSYDLTLPSRVETNSVFGLVFHDFSVEVPQKYGMGVEVVV